ncbi:EXLDI protein [Nocardia sp. NBC_00508]|uniref:EXLDI protein n=1 Tax=Nocardia sp. NBC_00508 TaxID=2975992 RepID=UPI002E81C9FF|nr:EXLDI protein [Nocardia sp. NBC_00508]WUD68728.1 EXLDI protein [Nocardia sp. NBC_00508]
MTSDPNNLTSVDIVEEVGGHVTFAKGGTEPGGAEDFREIVLKVGPGGARRQRFFGKLLGESREYTKAGVDSVRVYVSRKGKFVVHRQESNWREMAAATDWTDWKNWRVLLGFIGADHEWGDYTVEIVDSPTELAGWIPEHIYRTVVDVAENPSSQDLQI